MGEEALDVGGGALGYKVKAAMQALQLVTGVLQSRGGDDEVMRQLQAAKARAATERKLKEKLKGMKDNR